MDPQAPDLTALIQRRFWLNASAVALGQVFSLLFMTAWTGSGLMLFGLPYLAFCLLVTSSLYWRFSRPLVMSLLVLLGLVVSAALSLLALDLWWTVPVVVYHWARYGSDRVRYGALAVSCLLAVAGSLTFLFPWFFLLKDDPMAWLVPLISIFLALATVAVSWFWGDSRRLREAQQRALLERNRQLVHEREQERKLAALDERARIAREMHDIVAHSLSAIITQADGARYSAAAGQQEAGQQEPSLEIQTLETISTTARSALAEMRGLLGVLRTDDEEVLYQPLPALHNLGQLVEQSQRLGLPVTLIEDYAGVEEKLPAGAQLTIYRVVQEGLTNAAKHAAGTPSMTIRVQALDDRLEIDMLNAPGSAGRQPVPGAKQGLLGMRERIHMYGGQLHYGHLPDDSFQVRASIPYAP